ncbi:MAG: prolipoprotein diacylglyceryl transferase [Anaerolineae bacterium]|nr:prolipoprotein diacylglyceryl transferase [Anaerolineae bacterium]MDK1081529.1 prolipoprotein diacylglyceryl transferase [Anaerolineae bacterium]MDK1118306.1 prolipoprotein diacylglyceryl transferase [Anaerolineae bacterium]
MIDPIIFSFPIFGIQFTLRWYGVLVMLGVIVSAWLADREYTRRGENGEHIWNSLLWALPIGLIGARLWYVANSTLGGNTYYMDNPGQILNIPQGGLHFFGGLLFGAITLIIYLKRNNLDVWLLLDVAAPITMIGQAIARPANFINQELYGHPTTLPWGIPIDSGHRLAQFSDMSLFPDTTRFHPAFAYEMVWNFLTAGTLLWAAKRFPEKFKPGALVGWWLVLAGMGRVFLEAFRPDQPRIAGMDISYSRVVAGIMALAGVIMLLIRYGYIRLKFAENWSEQYRISKKQKHRRKR